MKKLTYALGKCLMVMLLVLCSTISVWAANANQEMTAEVDFIFSNVDEETGVQYVYVSLDTKEQSMTEATLHYEEMGEVKTAQAEQIIENCALYLLEAPQENETRTFLSMDSVINGETVSADLTLATEEGEVIPVSAAAAEAAQSDITLEQVEACVITADGGVTETELKNAAENVQQLAAASPAAFALNDEVQASTRGAKKNYIVVLDPGHGITSKGSYTGTNFTYGGTTYYEDNITMSIAKYTKAALERYEGVTVYMTKDSVKQNPTVKERVDYASSVNADILVSQHINSAGLPGQTTTAHGAEVCVPKTDRFNDVIAQNAQNLASDILKKLINLGFNDRGLKVRDSENGSTYKDGSTADYLGIVNRSMKAGIPGIIVEHGFLNNTSDFYSYLASEDQYKQLGEADAQGIADYLGLSKEKNNIVDGWFWRQTDGKWYYMDNNGNKKTGWATIDGSRYYFNDSGVMQTGWVGEDYLDPTSGALTSGHSSDSEWVKNSIGWWLRRTDGSFPVNQWELVNGAWYYFDGKGYMKTGWLELGGRWYFLNANGVMITGWILSDGVWYYTNESGVLQTGWVLLGGVWYYLEPNGVMATGWKYLGGSWYYMNGNGAMLPEGWQQIGGDWYYMNQNGSMHMGWISLKDTWYYLGGSGAMLTGWQMIGGKWYYMDRNGAMACDTTVDGYRVDKTGAWVQ